MDLSVVIPVFNEAESIALLVSEICAQLDDALEYEIIVVDDGSTDSTSAVVQDARATHPQLRVLRHTRRCGQSAAITSGVQAARAPWIVTLDGDGQNDPADIGRLYRDRDTRPGHIRLITGYRLQRHDGWLRRVSSRIANTVRSVVLSDNTPDSGCGLKLFARDTFLALPQFDHMHRFMPALVQRQGGAVLSVPVNHRARRHGKSKYGLHNRLWVGIVDLAGVWWLLRRSSLPVVSEIE